MQTFIDYFTNYPKYTITLIISLIVSAFIIALIVFFYKKRKSVISNDTAKKTENTENNSLKQGFIEENNNFTEVIETNINNHEKESDIAQFEETTIKSEEPVVTEVEFLKNNELIDNIEDCLSQNSVSNNSINTKAEIEDNSVQQNVKYAGKWVIFEFDGRFYADLKASNGEIMLRTESYTTLSGIKSGIDTLKKNIELENYAISLDKNGNFVFKIFSTAKRLLCVGEGYSTREQCEKAFASVRRFSKTATITIENKN